MKRHQKHKNNKRLWINNKQNFIGTNEQIEQKEAKKGRFLTFIGYCKISINNDLTTKKRTLTKSEQREIAKKEPPYKPPTKPP